MAQDAYQQELVGMPGLSNLRLAHSALQSAGDIELEIELSQCNLTMLSDVQVN